MGMIRYTRTHLYHVLSIHILTCSSVVCVSKGCDFCIENDEFCAGTWVLCCDNWICCGDRVEGIFEVKGVNKGSCCWYTCGYGWIVFTNCCWIILVEAKEFFKLRACLKKQLILHFGIYTQWRHLCKLITMSRTADHSRGSDGNVLRCSQLTFLTRIGYIHHICQI